MTKQLHCFAPAKINLFLHILGQKPNGYHLLQTIFQRLNFGDELFFNMLPSTEITLESPECPLNPTENLIIKAADLLQKTYDIRQGAKIRLNKRIPMGAGLGGGSSDAASTLLALNQLWQLELSTQTLMELGQKLGADVPFFILQKNAWGEGIGEILTPLDLPIQHYVLLYPACHVDTKLAFQHPNLPRSTPPITPENYCFEKTHNDFEALVVSLYPEVGEAREWLSQFGNPRMTGSGSCLFLPVETSTQAQTIQTQAPSRWFCIACRSLP